jgi:uncharacterized protein YbjT (DUF2867 family)
MRVVVFGATGDQGSAQVRALVAAGHRPVAVSRRPGPWSQQGQAVETLAADFADPASLAAACAGADAVFLNLPSTAAATTGIRMLVFNTSLPVPQQRRGFAAQDARHEMRRRVMAAGVPAVSVEPVVFLDNLLKGWAWPSIARDRRIVYAHRETLDVSWICHDDLAALMLAALERPHLAGRSFAVGGAQTVRLPQLAEKLGRAWNLPLTWQSQSIDDFCQRMRQVFEGRSSLEADRLIGELHRIYTWYNESPERPFCIDMAPVLRELPVALTPIEVWAARQVLPPVP